MLYASDLAFMHYSSCSASNLSALDTLKCGATDSAGDDALKALNESTSNFQPADPSLSRKQAISHVLHRHHR